MCRTYGVALTPPLSLILSFILPLTFIATVLLLVAISPRAWEEVEWDANQLRSAPGVNVDSSYFNEDEGFYVIASEGGNINETLLSYLRDWTGGIWEICDKMSSMQLGFF